MFEELRPIARETIVGLETLVQQAVRRGERLGTGLAGMVLGALVMLIATLGLLAAGILGLSRVIGVELALAVGSLLTAGLGAGCYLLARRYVARPTPRDAEKQMEFFEQRETLRLAEEKAEKQEDRDKEGAGVEGSDFKDRVISAALKDPKVTASLIFAAFGVLGPARSLRMISRAAAAVSLFAAAREAWVKEGEEKAADHPPPAPASPV